MLNKINSKKISKPFAFLLAGGILFNSRKIEFHKSSQYKEMLSAHAGASGDKEVKTKSSSRHPAKSSTKINILKSSANSRHPAKSSTKINILKSSANSKHPKSIVTAKSSTKINILKSSANSRHPAKRDDKNIPKSSTKHPSAKINIPKSSTNSKHPKSIVTASVMNVNKTDNDGNACAKNFKFKIKGENAELISFNKNSKDTIITIPDAIKFEDKIYSVTSLGYRCFGDCSGLRNITIPKSVISLGDYCFIWCKSLQNIEIPSSVTSIGNSCFCGCRKLKTVNIPSGVISLGNFCFHNCRNLQNITIPKSVTSLGYYCFCGCSSLKKLLIPASVASLEKYCFDGCSNLKTLLIPTSVTSLEKCCFNGCHSLRNIKIPKNQFSDSFKKQLVALGFKNVAILNPSSAKSKSPNYKNLKNDKDPKSSTKLPTVKNRYT